MSCRSACAVRSDSVAFWDMGRQVFVGTTAWASWPSALYPQVGKRVKLIARRGAAIPLYSRMARRPHWTPAPRTYRNYLRRHINIPQYSKLLWGWRGAFVRAESGVYSRQLVWTVHRSSLKPHQLELERQIIDDRWLATPCDRPTAPLIGRGHSCEMSQLLQAASNFERQGHRVALSACMLRWMHERRCPLRRSFSSQGGVLMRAAAFSE